MSQNSEKKFKVGTHFLLLQVRIRIPKPLPLARTIQVGAFANNVAIETGTLTQWKLIDVNGDGFPDMVFDSQDLTAFNDTSCDSGGNCRPVLRQDHSPTTQLLVFYHTGPMMAGSGADTQKMFGAAQQCRLERTEHAELRGFGGWAADFEDLNVDLWKSAETASLTT